MKKNLTLFLRAGIVLIGVAAFVFLLWEPWVEGVNANATTVYQIYFDDPFLAFAYVASIPFFVGLYQAFKLLGYVAHNQAFSSASVKALRTIKNCAIVQIGFIIVGVTWILQMESDDRPPIVAMGTLTTIICIAVGASAARLQKRVQHAINPQSQN